MNIGPLVPIPRKSKGPKLSAWNKLTPEELAQHMEHNNGGNVGLRLDHYASLDPDSQAARNLCDQWEKEGKLPPTIAWRTASGAIRRLFIAPPGITRMQIMDLHFDLRHGSDFQDVIPPSYVVDTEKGIDGYYTWLPGQDPDSIGEPAHLPAFVLEFFRKHASTSFCENRAKNDNAKLSFSLGSRDEDIFSTAYALFRGGMNEADVTQIIEIIARQCSPEFPLKDAYAKIESAQKRCQKREKSLTDEVEDWIMTSKGQFKTSDVHRELDLASRDLKKQANEVCRRLVEKGKLTPCGDKRGCYRVIEESEEMDWQSADIENSVDVKWPFELEQLVKIYPGNIVVVAGEKNAGKSAFLYNFIKLNQNRFKIAYFNSEASREELKLRLSAHDDILVKDWTFKTFKRSEKFPEAIFPNRINIIDYFELTDNFFQIGGEIRQIHDRLKKGICVIALQMKTGAGVGRGGDFSREKARMYLTMGGGKLKIVDGKIWASDKNPNGMEFRYKLLRGWKFIEWE